MTAEREASGEEGCAGAIMAKNGLAKASVAVSVLALVVAVASLLSARGRPPEEVDGPDGLSELRAEIAALTDSVKSCRTAVEASGAERTRLADRIGKLEREVASASDEARPKFDPELICKLVEQEVRARLKDDKGDRDVGIRDWFAKMGVDGGTVAKIRAHFKGNGFSDKQAAEALGATLKVLHEMREEGKRYGMDPRIREWLEGKLGLKGEQVAQVEGIARRLQVHLDGERRRERPAPAPDGKEVF